MEDEDEVLHLGPPKYDCPLCCDGTVVSDTCDLCDERHCPACEPCACNQADVASPAGGD